MIKKGWDDRPVWGGCHEWIGMVSKGAPCVNFNGKKQGVRRLIWESLSGDIPKDKFVVLKCDNKKCIWIGHMSLSDTATGRNIGDPYPDSVGYILVCGSNKRQHVLVMEEY